MCGSGWTRYRPEQGGGVFLDSFVKDVVKEAWKGFKSGGPWGLLSLVAERRGAKRGAVRGAKRAIKRKADSAINSAHAVAKRAVNDIFG